MPEPQHASVAIRNRRRSLRTWQDRLRDPSLTSLLILELCAVFLAEPLAARGLPLARAIGEVLVLAVVAIVVFLSQRRGAFLLIILGLAATLACAVLGLEASSVAASVLRRGGTIITF